MISIEDVRADIAAFADDSDEVIVDPSGQVVFTRSGIDVNCRLVEDRDGNAVVQMENGQRMPYAKFLTHELARLDVFATRILNRRAVPSLFVDGEAFVSQPAEDDYMGSSVAVLKQECEDVPAFASRVTFVTADAGHGKTALLRYYQAQVAQQFLDGNVPYVFWHVDLQGRQLLRLSEALMGDLAELRHTGLFMPGVVRLLRARKLILAVDGFDELSAEQGGDDALGALTGLVSQLDGHGVVIAAARRTFFDAEDYVRKTSLMRRMMPDECQFDQLGLEPWARTQAIEYLGRVEFEGRRFETGIQTYEEILRALGNDPEHPMLTRPFLLTQVAKAMLISNLRAADFVRTATDLHSGVEAVVNAFVKREVTEKWKSFDSGEPYLTGPQHMELLATVAEEMYRSQKERLSLDVIETLAVVLFDQWKIESSRRPQIIDMVRSHVLLVLPEGIEGDYRAFDHPEFRDYFVAYALRTYLDSALAEGETRGLLNFLSYSLLTDGTARYVCAMVIRDAAMVGLAASILASQVSREWRPSHLHANVGTLLAILIADLEFPEQIELDAALTFSSLVFENAAINRVTFMRSNFVNVSLRNARWRGVVLDGCDVNEMIIDIDTSTMADVRFVNTKVGCLRLVKGAEEVNREYAPTRIWQALAELGVSNGESQLELPVLIESQDSELLRAARRFLRMFNRATTVSDVMIEHRFKGGGVTTLILDQVIPCAEKHGVIESRVWKGSGSQRLWSPRVEIDSLLAAEDSPAGAPHDFWAELRAMS